jgi:hypothetical protein
MKLLEKQQEHASLQALKEASGHLLERVEELAKMGNVMADGGEGAFSPTMSFVTFEVLKMPLGITC